MSTITLLTDFGLEDPYVGMMKGVILSIHPSARIIDITHHIDPQDLALTAFIIGAAYPYFPEGTVHIVVVDPGVGSNRIVVALKLAGHIFIAPDNGVLTQIIDKDEIDGAVCVENSDYFLKKVSRTFHGRDVFAPVGAHLAAGVELRHLGPRVDPKDLVRLKIPRPLITEKNELFGNIVFIDRFGNCITNVDEDCLEKIHTPGARLQVEIGGQKIYGLSPDYESAGLQSPLAIVGSFGCLEIAVNRGSAQQYFKVKAGDVVRVVSAD
jgi:S-adenosylmethionine hydrolase